MGEKFDDRHVRNRKVVGDFKSMGGASLRYFTYYLIFPDDTYWVDQTPFTHNVEYELNLTTFGKVPRLRKSLLKTGECSWKDMNGMWHRVVIEKQKRKRVWGKNSGGVSL